MYEHKGVQGQSEWLLISTGVGSRRSLICTG